MKDLAGKTAFVTGAASGIGLGIATALAQAGAKVMLCDVEEAALAKAVEGLKQTNADVDGVKADVSLKAELKAAAEAVVSRYGKVHILVNNAGVGGGGHYGAWTDAAWDWTLGVNLMATVWGIEIFGPLIGTARRGRTHRVDRIDRRADLPRQRHSYNVIQVWRRRAFGGPARRARSARDRRFGAVSRVRKDQDRGLFAQPASTFRAAARTTSWLRFNRRTLSR